MVTSPGAVTSNAAAFSLACGQVLTVTSDAPASAQVGAGYSGTVTVSGGSGGYTWEVTGLPPGLTASPGGPALTVSGSPQTAGTFTAEVTVHDTARPHDAGTARLTLTVADAPPQVSGGLGTAIVGEPYSASLSASGGNGGVRWGRVSGLPRGMTATPRGDTLVIAGTPAWPGTSRSRLASATPSRPRRPERAAWSWSSTPRCRRPPPPRRARPTMTCRLPHTAQGAGSTYVGYMCRISL